MKALAQGLWAPGLALLCLGYLVLMLVVGTEPERVHLIRYQANGVMAENPEVITRANLRSAGKSVSFKRQAEGWARVGDSAAVDANLAKSISLAVKFMHTAEPVRVFKASELSADAQADFGLSKPSLSILLQLNGRAVLEADFGDLSSDGLYHYMRVEGRTEVFLMSRFVLHEWQTVVDSVP